MGARSFHLTAVLLACAALPFALFIAGLELLVFGMRCDEGCNGLDWRGRADAWQWDFFAVAAPAGLVLFVVFLWAISNRRRGFAGIALAVYLVSTYAILAFVQGSATALAHELVTWHDRDEALLLFGSLAAPAAAVALVPDREPDAART